jgi:hypothetical protein
MSWRSERLRHHAANCLRLANLSKISVISDRLKAMAKKFEDKAVEVERVESSAAKGHYKRAWNIACARFSFGALPRASVLRPRPRSRGPFGGHSLGADRHRALAAGAVFFCILAIAAVVGKKYFPSERSSPEFNSDGTRYSAGTVAFVPTSGSDCRERVIDNATWLIRDNAPVDCATALQNPIPSTQDRITIIRNAFQRK